MFENAVQPPRRDHRISAARRISPVGFRATAPRQHRQAAPLRYRQNRANLLRRTGLDHFRDRHAGYRIGRRRIANVVAPNNRGDLRPRIFRRCWTRIHLLFVARNHLTRRHPWRYGLRIQNLLPIHRAHNPGRPVIHDGGAERSEVDAPDIDFTPGFSTFLTCPCAHNTGTFAQKNCACPEISNGCGTYSPVFSPHNRGRGKTLVGFESCNGSNAHRTRCIVSKSGSANITDMYFFFSSPTPCSPVIEPPAFTHNSTIRNANSSAACACPSIARSNSTSG